ncbi:MAG: DNA repair protein RadC [Candidatus Omnitrophica bacterium]|nr:DNA repair protein RadC [Candidatus Omnitrophota bacterium]MBU4478410.1 DNA repair protein RadC [Candidatus Omnitrophota bacterium]
MTEKRLKNMPITERPREKLCLKGKEALSDQELLAILLGKGSKKHDVLTLAQKLIAVIDKKGIDVTIDDLVDFDGVGKAKATIILAAFEFVRRRIKKDGITFEKPSDIVPLLRHYADRKQEHFLCVSLNGANEILNTRVVTIGLADRSHVHPREVFADVLVDRASAIILAHNHPAGSLDPSEEDIAVTKQIAQAGKILGIVVLDHIIFNQREYLSFVERGISIF